MRADHRSPFYLYCAVRLVEPSQGPLEFANNWWSRGLRCSMLCFDGKRHSGRGCLLQEMGKPGVVQRGWAYVIIESVQWVSGESICRIVRIFSI